MGSPEAPEGQRINFEYSETALADWSDKLRTIKYEGHNTIRSHVFWGVHEQLRSIWDFSRSPNLRLEKFFSAVQKEGLCIDLLLGFFSDRRTFPLWTFETEKQALIGGIMQEEGNGGFSLVEVPSIHEKTLWNGFLAFLEELGSIVSLYQFPEGPIRNIEVHFGMYCSDLNALSGGSGLEALRARYKLVERMNRVYQTAFKDFDFAFSERGMKLLTNKRPWLSCYDYRMQRDQLLDSVIERFQREALGRIFSSGSGISIFKGRKKGAAVSKCAVVFEPVFLESSVSGKCFPCFPYGYVNAPAANAFRLWEYFKFHCSKNEIGLGSLPLFEGDSCPLNEWITLICGPYLSRGSFRCLVTHLEGGGHIFFPFGLPKYDEYMDCLDWGLKANFIQYLADFGRVGQQKKSEGTIWVTSDNVGLTEDLWERVRFFHSTMKEVVFGR